jgi:hypothetical protein
MHDPGSDVTLVRTCLNVVRDRVPIDDIYVPLFFLVRRQRRGSPLMSLLFPLPLSPFPG